MNKRPLTVLLALLGGLATTSFDRAPARPVPGPGNVAYAVKDFLRRLDADDNAALMLSARAHEISFVLDKQGALEQVDKAVSVSFTDVAVDGKAIEASKPAAFASELRKHATGNADRKREVDTEITGIRCNCDSARCSLAVVDFARTYRLDGVLTKRVPMRATALLEYGDDAKWRIYHWHASRVGTEQFFKGGR